jgi:hypothetical protein
MEMLEMKNSNKKQNIEESITNIPDQARERMSGIKDKLEEILHLERNKEKIRITTTFKSSGT